MRPYCGWIKALRNDGIRRGGPVGHDSHRPKGIVKIERIATFRSLKRTERQRAQAEICQERMFFELERNN